MVEKGSYEVPAIFQMMAREGNVEEKVMYNTYNMGIGMVLAVDPADVGQAVKAIQSSGEEAFVIGKVEDGEKGVTLC